jgi:hypothetical protein
MQAFADPCTLGNFICLASTSLVNTYDRLTSLSAPSLNELRLRSNDVRSVTAAPYAYINEVDAIQEVLFVLGGSAGQLFQRLSDDNILPRNAVPNPSIDAKDRSMFKVSIW